MKPNVTSLGRGFMVRVESFAHRVPSTRAPPLGKGTALSQLQRTTRTVLALT